jgi:hypothetical protein
VPPERPFRGRGASLISSIKWNSGLFTSLAPSGDEMGAVGDRFRADDHQSGPRIRLLGTDI